MTGGTMIVELGDRHLRGRHETDRRLGGGRARQFDFSHPRNHPRHLHLLAPVAVPTEKKMKAKLFNSQEDIDLQDRRLVS